MQSSRFVLVAFSTPLARYSLAFGFSLTMLRSVIQHSVDKLVEKCKCFVENWKNMEITRENQRFAALLCVSLHGFIIYAFASASLLISSLSLSFGTRIVSSVYLSLSILLLFIFTPLLSIADIARLIAS